MKTKNLSHLSKLMFCVTLSAGPSCFADGIAARPVGGDTGSDPAPYVIGWKFSVSSPVTITGLAYVDATSRGLVDAHLIGIFDASTGTLVYSGTVPAGTAARFQDGYRIIPATYSLNPGTYVIAGQRNRNGDPAIVRAQQITTTPQVTFIEERELQTDQFVLPTTNEKLNEAGDFGPSFTMAESPSPTTISGITNSGSFQPRFAGGTFLSLFGAGLSSTTRAWGPADFANGSALPTSLDGVSVTVGGKPAYVQYVSPGQINIFTPGLTTSIGGTSIAVKTPTSTAAAWIDVQASAPAFFTWLTNTSASGKYLVAQHSDYTNLADVGLLTIPTTPARPGETIILYGTGFGATSPAIADGIITDKVYTLAATATATLGGVTAQVVYAGLTPTLAGVYQFNIVVPTTVPDGDLQLVVTTAGVSSYPGLITVRR